MPKTKSNNNSKTTAVKSRSWAFVAYPESVPDNWLEMLRLSGLKVAVSPLHDKDLNADEQEKKPHWHIILVWESGSTTYAVAERLTKSINGTIPVALTQIRGYYRYFTHKDNPEKYQYDEKEIIILNGFNILDFTDMTKSETDEIVKQIIKLIIDKEIVEYSRLLIYLMDNNLNQEFSIASSKTILFNSFICSRRHEEQKERDEKEKEERRKEFDERLKIEDERCNLQYRYRKDPENGNIINIKTGQVVGKEEI